ncbi:hypothetical protein AGMMS49949_03680 [Alphaproteobacteria bacterium]|nr:hypothetical protein AGMMS49949_03680 [Alphaproteobacteria bacterium]GHS96557.1 hypothetical protein AGMMS50296_2820 [Alphaproteobacteria bacterium]
MKTTFFNIILCIEHTYRLFLDNVKRELDLLGIYDINSAQALMIYNLARQTVSVGELTSRRMYQGSNVSYNLKKLISTGYILQTPSDHDRRSLHVCLSEKGVSLYDKIDQFVERQSQDVRPFLPGTKSLDAVYKNFQAFENFWNGNTPRK